MHQQRLGKKQDGYKIFLSGCGGTGKSHVVGLIQRDTAYLLQHVLCPDPDQPIVLVTAPTGSAAYNINGSTIHSALSIFGMTGMGQVAVLLFLLNRCLIRHGSTYICQLRLLLLKYITPHPSFF